MLNKVLGVFLLSSFCGLANAAHDLTTINDTDFYSTAYINHRSCSSSIPGGEGITPPHGKKTVSGFLVGLACMGNSSNCNADIYLDDDCHGKPIATVILDTSTGVKSIQMLSNDYIISTTDNFTFTLSKV